MSDIVEFLTARLDSEAAQARAAASRNAAVWTCPASAVLDIGEDLLNVMDSGVGEHIRRHDPASVLRDVEAKRGLLVEHQPFERYGDDGICVGIANATCSTCVDESSLMGGNIWDFTEMAHYPCGTLRLLASVYAGHPDFDGSWGL